MIDVPSGSPRLLLRGVPPGRDQKGSRDAQSSPTWPVACGVQPRVVRLACSWQSLPLAVLVALEWHRLLASGSTSPHQNWATLIGSRSTRGRSLGRDLSFCSVRFLPPAHLFFTTSMSFESSDDDDHSSRAQRPGPRSSEREGTYSRGLFSFTVCQTPRSTLTYSLSPTRFEGQGRCWYGISVQVGYPVGWHSLLFSLARIRPQEAECAN